MKNLPIGIQSFEELRQNNYLYVDKTHEIHHLITKGFALKFVRPPHFGKSLLLSTIEEIFKGNQNLFEGLYIYDKWDWTRQYPVIKLDWNNIGHSSVEKIEDNLKIFMDELADTYQITPTGNFFFLIENIRRKTGRHVVVLIDEYEKPLLDAIGTDEKDGIYEWLFYFYGMLKSAGEHIQFLLLTGRYNVSFADPLRGGMNHLNDITTHYKYAALCGFTQEEQESVFSEQLKDTAAFLGLTKDELPAIIRKWYGGYTWDGKTTVYDPFSLLSFFDRKKIDDYRYETGMPEILTERLKKQNSADTVLKPVVVDSSAFCSCDMENIGEISLLFQTGYLTIKEEQLFNLMTLYTLGIPNQGVRKSLMRHLSEIYAQNPVEHLKTLVDGLHLQICENEADELQNRANKVVFLDIDGVLQPGSQNRFKYLGDEEGMKALYAELFQKHGVDYKLYDKYDFTAAYYDWREESVVELKRILDAANAKIVLTSDWRVYYYMKDLFKLHGLDKYFSGRTPYRVPLSDMPAEHYHDLLFKELGLVRQKGVYFDQRAIEIKVYLKRHPEVQNYVALDDMNLGKDLGEHFVWVKRTYLTTEDANLAIKILNSNNDKS